MSIDIVISEWIAGILPRSIAMNLIMMFFSFCHTAFNLLWFVIIVIYVLLRKHKWEFWKRLALPLNISIFLTLIFTFVIKVYFNRPRPNFSYTNMMVCPTDPSFPSMHSSLAFAVFVCLAHVDKKNKFIFYTLASLITFSRVYLGCHYFFDVMVGSIIGYTIAILVNKVNWLAKLNFVSHFISNLLTKK